LNIVDFIGCGKPNAVTRKTLCQITGLSDRAVRQEVENARHRGNIILNNQSGIGYYMTADIDEIERQYHTNDRRAKSILHYQKPLRQALKAAGRL